MRAQILLLPLVVVAVGCELMSGLSDLQKDESFNPDAALPEGGADTGTSTADTAPGNDTGTMMASDTGMMAMDTAVADTAKPDTAMGCGEPESITFGMHCYFPIKMDLSFDAAKTACMGKGAYLAMITSAAENTAVSAIDKTAQRWIGLSKGSADPQAKDSYKWANGTAWKTGDYDGWGDMEPNGAATAATAARFLVDGVKWYDREGAASAAAPGIHAICEKD